MPNFNHSERVEQVAERLIKQHHEHLSIANIAYLMKEGEVDRKIGEPDKGQIRKVAKSRKLPALYEFLSDYHFAIEVDQGIWDLLTLEQQEAVIDQELCRLGWDAEKGPYIRETPLIIYPEIIERHGLYTEELRKFGEQFRQLKLFPPPAEVKGNGKAKPLPVN